MDDLISRQAILDMLEDINNHIIDGCRYNHKWCVNWVKGLPSIDAVQVVKCKDCKYARITYDGECKYCDIWFPDEAEYLDGDYYCASAERKEETCNNTEEKLQ